MRYVRRISKVEQDERQRELISILKENELEFSLQRLKQNENWVENIVVSVNPSHKRLVIGAHYDSIEGSTGANDNASAVSVLVRLAKQLKMTDNSIDFVFFDREEYPNRGSEAYINSVGIENINAMINLDMCGFGDTIAIYIKDNMESNKFYNVLTDKNIKKHNVAILGFLPNGDDSAFDEKGINNISIAMLPQNDILFFQKISLMISNGQEMTEEIQNEFMNLEVVSTMHNAKNDNINAVSQKTMDLLFNFLLDGLKHD